MSSNTDREPPNRYLDKREAIRHLIHAAVRMMASGEDPFAIHLLIQSADKLLIDLAKRSNSALTFDWENVIKPDYRSEFFRRHRETYNFFKHADKDTENLPVHNIAEMNVCGLWITIQNYRCMFGTITEHMNAFKIFMLLWKPIWFADPAVPEEKREGFNKSMATLRDATPAEFFKVMFSQENGEHLERERTADVSDGFHFWSTPFGKQKT